MGLFSHFWRNACGIWTCFRFRCALTGRSPSILLSLPVSIQNKHVFFGFSQHFPSKITWVFPFSIQNNIFHHIFPVFPMVFHNQQVFPSISPEHFTTPRRGSPGARLPTKSSAAPRGFCNSQYLGDTKATSRRSRRRLVVTFWIQWMLYP